MRPNEPTSVIFDLDETLLADAASTEAALIATIERAYLRTDDGGPLDAARLASAVRDHARRLWRAGPYAGYAEAIGISASEGLWGDFGGDAPELRALADWAPGYYRDVWSAVLAEQGVADPARAADLSDNLAARFREERLARHLLFPDTLPALDALRGTHRLALLTNGAPDIQRAKIAGAGLAPYFAVIVVSGEVGVGKPDPRIYTHTLALLDVTAGQAVMVGDNLVNDVRGAQEAGLRAVWLTRTDGLAYAARRTLERLRQRVSPDATIATLAELPAAIAGMSASG
jgi:putative hydrolase of the HAD superfamily